MSYLLDTNVVSELRKPHCDANVRNWASAVDDSSLHLPVIVIGELRAGVERLRRRDPVQASRFDAWLVAALSDFGSRILPVDRAVADRWGLIDGTLGPLPTPDALIAATALTYGLAVVTRNVRDFERTGVTVVNPWSDPVS